MVMVKKFYKSATIMQIVIFLTMIKRDIQIPGTPDQLGYYILVLQVLEKGLYMQVCSMYNATMRKRNIA